MTSNHFTGKSVELVRGWLEKYNYVLKCKRVKGMTLSVSVSGLRFRRKTLFDEVVLNVCICSTYQDGAWLLFCLTGPYIDPPSAKQTK